MLRTYKCILCVENLLKMVKTKKRQLSSTPTLTVSKKPRQSRTSGSKNPLITVVDSTNDSVGKLKLGVDFYDVDSITLGKALLGKVLCRKISSSGKVLKGRIVETEAYPGVCRLCKLKIYKNKNFRRLLADFRR